MKTQEYIEKNEKPQHLIFNHLDQENDQEEIIIIKEQIIIIVNS